MRNCERWQDEDDDEPSYAVVWGILGAATFGAAVLAALWLWAVPHIFGV